MKILIVNISDFQGGASKAGYRLHQSLLDCNVDSKMLVQNKISDNFTVIGATTKIEKIAYKLNPYLDSLPTRFYKNRTKTLFYPALLSFSSIVNKINAMNPDIVHLHWVCAGILTIEDLAKIKALIVWSLHDMWAFTGGCHYDEECSGYKKSCGNCKVLGSNFKNDLSKIVFNRKKKEFSKLDNLTVVALSGWLKICAENSVLFNNKNIVNLPNLINIKQYSPVNKVIARQILNLPQNKKFVLYGAMNATSDPRKGFREISSAIKALKSDNIELLIFGSSQPQESPVVKYKIHYLGHLYDDISLKILYSAADVLVVPSLQENLSNVIMESLSCATPVVGFDVGGNKDMIDHLQNGYLAKPFDVSDLAYGIEWVICHGNYQQLCDNARQKILSYFDSNIVVKQYIDLYRSLLHSHKQ